MRDWAERDLKNYLAGHEDSIESGENDFGDLKHLFIYMFGREPRTTKQMIEDGGPARCFDYWHSGGPWGVPQKCPTCNEAPPDSLGEGQSR